MAVCSDCLHYDCCERSAETFIESFVAKTGVENVCRTFKDKSRFVEVPCKVGDTVYGKFDPYGKQINECKVIKSRACQFKDGTLHYFLDVEFYIIDPFYRDGRQMLCHYQAVLGEDFGSWDRVYLTRDEAEAALAKMG